MDGHLSFHECYSMVLFFFVFLHKAICMEGVALASGDENRTAEIARNFRYRLKETGDLKDIGQTSSTTNHLI